MKKLIFLFILLSSVLSINAQYKSFDFCDHLKNIDFGLEVGAVETPSYKESNNYKFSYGLSVSIFGFYADWVGNIRNHKRDVRVDKWDDSYSGVWHVGYKVPICKYISITPLCGQWYGSSGITNGYDWKVDNYGIVNHYENKGTITNFDYGAKIEVMINSKYWYGTPSYGFRFGITITKYAKYGNVGFAKYF